MRALIVKVPRRPLRSRLDSVAPRPSAFSHEHAGIADHRLSRSFLASSGRSLYSLCQHEHIRPVSCAPSAGAERRSQPARTRCSVRGSVITLRCRLHRSPAGGPSRFLCDRRSCPRYPSDVPRSWTVLVRAGVVDGEQALLTQEADDAGVVLLLGTNGASARIRWGSDHVAVATGTPIAAARWYRVWLAVDPASGRVLIGSSRWIASRRQQPPCMRTDFGCQPAARCCWRRKMLRHQPAISPAS